jgi:integrase
MHGETGLERITPHECRQYLRLIDDRGRRQCKGSLRLHGHANIAITLDLYGHLMPGNEAEAAGLLDAYLTAQRKAAEGKARGAEVREVAPA